MAVVSAKFDFGVYRGVSYDAWGKVISTTGTLASTVGAKNPFRYRGYYYDTESGFYYLQSRYYDPNVGRFLNPDSLVDVSVFKGLNLYSYCGNNPVNMTDSNGHFYTNDMAEHNRITAAIDAATAAVSLSVPLSDNTPPQKPGNSAPDPAPAVPDGYIYAPDGATVDIPGVGQATFIPPDKVRDYYNQRYDDWNNQQFTIWAIGAGGGAISGVLPGLIISFFTYEVTSANYSALHQLSLYADYGCGAIVFGDINSSFDFYRWDTTYDYDYGIYPLINTRN